MLESIYLHCKLPVGALILSWVLWSASLGASKEGRKGGWAGGSIVLSRNWYRFGGRVGAVGKATDCIDF